MNGLEAIELMRQGKMVKRIDVDIKFRINNDRVEGMNHSDIWCEEFLFHINANYEEYIEPKSLTGWERSEDDEFYIILCGGQTVAECNWDKIDETQQPFTTTLIISRQKKKQKKLHLNKRYSVSCNVLATITVGLRLIGMIIKRISILSLITIVKISLRHITSEKCKRLELYTLFQEK